MKECLKCKLLLPLTEFRDDIKCKSGKRGFCQDCERMWRKEKWGRSKGFTTPCLKCKESFIINKNKLCRACNEKNGKRECKRCGELLDVDLFYKNYRSCRTCYMKFHYKYVLEAREKNPERHKILDAAAKRRLRKLRPEKYKLQARLRGHKKLGLSEENYLKMLETQNNLCEICSHPPPATKALVVDHNHQNGQIRGLLCDRCNRSIGLLRDDPVVIKKAAAYLEKYQQLAATQSALQPQVLENEHESSLDPQDS